jgi:hypothetical protein
MDQPIGEDWNISGDSTAQVPIRKGNWNINFEESLKIKRNIKKN